ncbi:MAG TPA: twin-arginine translocation signal domain-containing protein [Acidimicrobiia bacterium]|nr:twin-arginine translocation signal domain-containing protein [Acidimicrobiia bacterium]
MSRRLAEYAARTMGERTSRRGFLRRVALAGSAIVTAPMAYALRPISAYQAIVLPNDCPPGAPCRSGWTEFCCTSTGVNTCPPGSVVGGWWRAEGSGYCGTGSRYYMDCHTESCGACGCDPSGTCSDDCVACNCHCDHDNCDLWKTCCTRFRYGQCNQHLPCIGPIVCRVVTCVPPWEWDSTCTTTDARDDQTATHDSACLRPPRGPYQARPAVVRNSTWMLRTTLDSGPAQQQFVLGIEGDVPLMADWLGSGVATAAVVRGARHGIAGRETLTWYIRQIEGGGQPDLVIEFGRPGDIPVAGDWVGNGVHTVGVFKGGEWRLRTRNASGVADISFVFGQAGDLPVVGDWTGSGRDGIGVVRGSRWILRNTATPGQPDHDFDFGSAAGIPVVGDWNGDGIDGPGLFDSGVWRISDGFGTPQTRQFTFGAAGDRPVVWRRR